MSKSLCHQQNKHRSNSVTEKNYTKIGRNVAKIVFSPHRNLFDASQQNESKQTKSPTFDEFIDTPFSLDFLKSQQNENSKYSQSRHPNQYQKQTSALNQNQQMSNQYHNNDSTSNPEDSVDEQEEEYAKLMRKLKKKKKETAVFKSIERNVIPPWVKVKLPEKIYDHKYTVDLSPIKCKSPSATINKHNNFSIKKKKDIESNTNDAIIHICKKNPLVKLEQFTSTLGSSYFRNTEFNMKSIIDDDNNASFDNNLILNSDQEQIKQTDKYHRTFLSVNTSRVASPNRVLSPNRVASHNINNKVTSNARVISTDMVIISSEKVQSIKEQKYILLDSLAYQKETKFKNTVNSKIGSQSERNNQEVEILKKTKEYQFKKLTALQELEQLQVEERMNQKKINTPQIGKYAVRKPLFQPQNTSKEIYFNDHIREDYINRLYQVKKMRDFSTYVTRKELFQPQWKSPDQGYYNQNYKHIERNFNHTLVDIKKSSPRKTTMNLELQPAQHVLLDYEIDKISQKQNNKTLANFSKTQGRRGDSLLNNSIAAKSYQNTPYSMNCDKLI